MGKKKHTTGSLPTPQSRYWGRHTPSKGSGSSTAGKGSRVWLSKLALHPLHILYLSHFLREICSWADLAILKSFLLFPWGCFLLPVFRETYTMRCWEGAGRIQHVPVGTQGLPKVSVLLPSGRILLMFRTAIRLLTSLLILCATPGYCRTEWKRAVLRLAG